MEKDDKEFLKSGAWLTIGVLILFVAVVPQLLIIPGGLVFGLLIWNIYVNQDDLKVTDISTELIYLILIVFAFIVPEVMYIASGYAFGKAITIGEGISW